MNKAPPAYRDIWKRKPALRAVYNDIFERIGHETIQGQTLEVGGGSGNLKALLPDTICTDIQNAPWVDVVCDAQRLPFTENTFSNVVMMDVLHHVEHPLHALREFQRVLRPGGRLVFCEPAITPLSGIFYRLFHDEPVDMSADPLAAADISSGRDPWLSNQAIPTLLTGRFRNALSRALPGLRPMKLEHFSFLAYPLSGGFQEWSLLPTAIAHPLLALEWQCRHLFGRLAAFRLLAVYERA